MTQHGVIYVISALFGAEKTSSRHEGCFSGAEMAPGGSRKRRKAGRTSSSLLLHEAAVLTEILRNAAGCQELAVSGFSCRIDSGHALLTKVCQRAVFLRLCMFPIVAWYFILFFTPRPLLPAPESATTCLRCNLVPNSSFLFSLLRLNCRS